MPRQRQSNAAPPLSRPAIMSVTVAHFQEVGFKFGKSIDVA